jgi:hypothetical protein
MTLPDNDAVVYALGWSESLLLSDIIFVTLQHLIRYFCDFVLYAFIVERR